MILIKWMKSTHANRVDYDIQLAILSLHAQPQAPLTWERAFGHCSCRVVTMCSICSELSREKFCANWVFFSLDGILHVKTAATQKTCSFQELWFTPQYKTYACWAMPSTFPRRARRTALPRLSLPFPPGYRECSCSKSASCPRRTRRRPDICCLLIFATGGNKTKVKTLTVDKSIGFLTISG